MTKEKVELGTSVLFLTSLATNRLLKLIGGDGIIMLDVAGTLMHDRETAITPQTYLKIR